MGSFLAYTLYSGVFLLLFFLFYKLLLARDKQMQLNRRVLLAIYVLSFAAWPLIDSGGALQVAKATHIPLAGFSAGALHSAGAVVAQPSSMLIYTILGIYVAGAATVLLLTLSSIIKLVRFISRGTIIRKEGYSIVVMPYEVSPFSFGKYVVVSASEMKETDADTVLAHEIAHIRFRHCLDLALAQGVCVVLWYNPVSWFMRGELKLLHEYEADAAVIEGGADPETYQKLLIRQSVGNRFYSLVNSLSYSRLKARIAMMQKEKSSRLRRWRSLCLAVAPALALALTSIPAVASGLDSIRRVRISLHGGGEQRVKLQMHTANGTVDVPDDEIVWLVTGNATGDKDNPGVNRRAVKVDGRLIAEPTAINFNDIESFVQIAPNDEYPFGLWDITLKK